MNFVSSSSLPSEILVKILSFLDVSSLLRVAEVNKLFHQLANDDGIWFRVYTSAFSCRMWPLAQWSASCWKKRFFRTVANHHFHWWRKELKAVNAYTGLPQQTEHVLRSMTVSWELRLRDRNGRERRHRQSRAVFTKTALILRWSGAGLPRYPTISSLQLHAVHTGAPGWSSLLLDLDVGSAPSQILGKDRLVVLRSLPHGVVVGTWRGDNKVAFIMVSLHFHRLVEKSFMGSPSWSPVLRTRDPSSHRPLGPRGRPARLRAALRPARRQHRHHNCCFMTLTLLDGFQEPFWCESAPVCIQQVLDEQSDYVGDHFLMDHRSAHGQLRMKLVWLKDQRQFFLIGLDVYISVLKVNKHFGTTY
uniref:F-box domain-containing protein n=1 Tax=Salarias fasciatus TaxID=181472 RepID=A0A672F5E9_SALFA